MLDLPDTGWTQVREGRHELLFEHGPLGPDEQPGHGHSDALSFELIWDGAQVIKDSGASEYQGPVRAYERSARAHATATVDGEGPDELWKDFRAGGRAQVTGSAPRGADKIRLLRASLRAWQGWTHERRIAFRPGRALVVQDEVRARKGALVESRLTLAPGFSFAGGRLLGPRPLELRVLRGEVSAVEEGSCASGFGQRVPRQVLVLRADAGQVAYALCAPGVEAALLPGGVLLDGAEVAP